MINRFILIITTIFCLSLLLGKVFAPTAKSDVKIPWPTGLSKDTQSYYLLHGQAFWCLVSGNGETFWAGG